MASLDSTTIPQAPPSVIFLLKTYNEDEPVRVDSEGSVDIANGLATLGPRRRYDRNDEYERLLSHFSSPASSPSSSSPTRSPTTSVVYIQALDWNMIPTAITDLETLFTLPRGTVSSNTSTPSSSPGGLFQSSHQRLFDKEWPYSGIILSSQRAVETLLRAVQRGCRHTQAIPKPDSPVAPPILNPVNYKDPFELPPPWHIRSLNRPIFVVGPATESTAAELKTKYLRSCRVYGGHCGKGKELADYIQQKWRGGLGKQFDGRPMLHLVGEKRTAVVRETLAEDQIQVKEVVCYKTLERPEFRRELENWLKITAGSPPQEDSETQGSASATEATAPSAALMQGLMEDGTTRSSTKRKVGAILQLLDESPGVSSSSNPRTTPAQLRWEACKQTHDSDATISMPDAEDEEEEEEAAAEEADAKNLISLRHSSAAHLRRWIVVFSPQPCRTILSKLGWLDTRAGLYNQSLRWGSEDDQGSSAPGRGVYIASIGPTTAKYMREKLGFPVDVCAKTPTAQGLREAIEEFIYGSGKREE